MIVSRQSTSEALDEGKTSDVLVFFQNGAYENPLFEKTI